MDNTAVYATTKTRECIYYDSVYNFAIYTKTKHDAIPI